MQFLPLEFADLFDKACITHVVNSRSNARIHAWPINIKANANTWNYFNGLGKP